MESDLYEIYTRDVNGNTTHETDIREAIHNFKQEGRESLRINIDGVVIRITPSHTPTYDHYDNEVITMTCGVEILHS